MRIPLFVTVILALSACPAGDVVGEGEGEGEGEVGEGEGEGEGEEPPLAVGDPCDSTSQCAAGLECAIGLDGPSARVCTVVVDAGCCRCREEQTTCESEITGACNIGVEEDGCAEGFVCTNGGFGGDGCCCFPRPHCVQAEARPLLQNCSNDEQCASGLCAGWTESCAECQPNDCAAGCPPGEGCTSAGIANCGFTCGPLVGFQEECISGEGLEAQCEFIRTCGPGLECSGTTAPNFANHFCDDVVNESEPCVDSQDLATDSCADGLRCTAAALCAPIDALREPGDHCDDGTQCLNGDCAGDRCN
ncbi:MAG: hypothetical protein Q8O67_13290 [Deltaproteobacteria bacterium]|nr:hypothetical protein [Deltaproteobacteria bacterium]